MDASRRGFFGFLAGAFVAPAVAKLDAIAPAVFTAPAAAASVGLTAELMAITRRAYVPSVYAQVYQSDPLLARYLREAKLAREAA